MPDVTVKIALGNFSAEVTGPSEYVDQKLEELLTRFLTSSRTPSSEGRTQLPAPESPGKELSAAEFVRNLGVKSQMDIALLLGYYLEQMKKASSFTSSDLSALGKEIKRPFTNISDVVAKLTSRGLLMNAGDKDNQRTYSLTASGEEYVEAMESPS